MAIDLYGAAIDTTGAAGPANADSNGNHSNDTVTNGGSMAQQATGNGNDLARGGGNVEQINTGAGNDRVHTADTAADGYSTQVKGGADNDYLFGGADRDILEGGDGDDYLSAGSGNDSLDGGAGNDKLDGRKGDDLLHGGSGRDLFQFKIDNGKQHINFGEELGNDRIDDFEQGVDKIDMRSIFSRMSDADIDTLLGKIEDLVTQKTDITKSGSKTKYSGDVYHGDDDSSNFGPSYDSKTNTVTYLKQSGTTFVPVDEAVIGTSRAVMSNGDVYEFTVSAEKTAAGFKSFIIVFKNLSLPEGSEDAGGSVTIDKISDLHASDFLREVMKVAHGTNGDDVVDYSTMSSDKGVRAYGYDGNDTLTGTAHKDVLLGSDGNDKLKGGDGDDELDGGNGDDILDGGDGSDYLYGGSGRNTLTGGLGAKDYFVFGGTVDAKGNFHFDKTVTTVTDFEVGRDLIKIANMGDGYNGTLQAARLEQRFDVAKELKQEGNDLVAGSDKTSQYILKDFFDGHNKVKDAAIFHDAFHHAITIEYVKAHLDDFVVWG